MAPTYYVIELSPRWLTVLLVALALVMVLAFAFGYGAAWSVLTGQPLPPEPPLAAAAAAATPTAVDVGDEALLRPTATVLATMPPTIPAATPTAAPRAPEPAPPPAGRAADEFWVQVLASSTRDAVGKAAERLNGLGFGPEHRQVTTAQVAGGNVLYKLRVGPFPDRDSADRVARRMRISGYPDAWVVTP